MINLGIGALVFAVWLIILFFGKTIGLSMLLFVLPFSYFFVFILEKNNKIKNPKFKLLLIPIMLLSSTYFIFNNNFFYKMNLLIIPILQSILVLGLLGENFEIRLDTINKIIGSFFNPLSFISDGIRNFSDSVREKLKLDIKSRNEEKFKKYIKAILKTIPIVLIIIILLSTADLAFASIFDGMFQKIVRLLSKINISSSFAKIICIVIAFCYFIGLFYYISQKYEPISENTTINTKQNDEFTIKLILISLNIVYLIFCYIQIKSLFLKNSNINYSQYARQGFFQLMIVSIINLITILIAKKRENKTERKFINYMSLVMIIFTFIIVISAGVRMYYYENVYGYTLLRLLVYCTLITESIMFIPTIFYVLDKKVNLPKAYFAIIIVAYTCMNFANFDNLIAKKNIDRFIKTGGIDLFYLEKETSTDSINQIIRLLEIEADVDNVKPEISRFLNEKYKDLNGENMDFRDFNISKIYAKKLIEKKFQK